MVKQISVAEAYTQAMEKGDIDADSTQMALVTMLDELLHQLRMRKNTRFFWKKKAPIEGVYIHGPVGVGKTYLMDLFFDCLPKGLGARFHFHHFMQQVDAKLRSSEGQRDPLRKIAKDLAKQAQVLCFDEFMVHDVAHAMILTELFSALFAEGLILVATSNALPDQLYPNGVQRQRFLPAIGLLKKHCRVMTLVALRDYRIGREPSASAWYSPLTPENNQAIRAEFIALQGDVTINELVIQKRRVQCLGMAPQGVWFCFDHICNLPRSQLDYLELANRFDFLFISNIPRFQAQHTAEAVLFIYLIDIMYDYGVRLVLSAQVAVQDLCENNEMRAEFHRSQSRLIEMQSNDYAKRHRHRKAQDFN